LFALPASAFASDDYSVPSSKDTISDVKEIQPETTNAVSKTLPAPEPYNEKERWNIKQILTIVWKPFFDLSMPLISAVTSRRG